MECGAAYDVAKKNPCMWTHDEGKNFTSVHLTESLEDCTMQVRKRFFPNLLANKVPDNSVVSANETQIAGTHYKGLAIQPWDYIVSNSIPYLEGSAIKYLTRWRDKGGIEDLKKAKHFVEKLIEVETSKGTK